MTGAMTTTLVQQLNRCPAVYKKSTVLYNTFLIHNEATNQTEKETGMSGIARMAKKLEGMLSQYQKRYIMKAIKRRIDFYKPLEFNTAVEMFMRRLCEDDLQLIKDMSESAGWKEYFDRAIKDTLIENAYYKFAPGYIKKRVMQKLNEWDGNSRKVIEITEFIMTKIEGNNIKRLKIFKEECSFKTFINVVISGMIKDYWRRKYKEDEAFEKYQSEYAAIFNGCIENPGDAVIAHEDQVIVRQAIEELIPDEKLAIKLKYYDDFNISQIARTLNCSHFKANKLIASAHRKIVKKFQGQRRG